MEPAPAPAPPVERRHAWSRRRPLPRPSPSRHAMRRSRSRRLARAAGRSRARRRGPAAAQAQRRAAARGKAARGQEAWRSRPQGEGRQGLRGQAARRPRQDEQRHGSRPRKRAWRSCAEASQPACAAGRDHRRSQYRRHVRDAAPSASWRPHQGPFKPNIVLTAEVSGNPITEVGALRPRRHHRRSPPHQGQQQRPPGTTPCCAIHRQDQCCHAMWMAAWPLLVFSPGLPAGKAHVFPTCAESEPFACPQ